MRAQIGGVASVISVEGIVDFSEICPERLRAALLYPAAMTASAQVETSHASVQQLAVSLCPLRDRGSKFRIAPIGDIRLPPDSGHLKRQDSAVQGRLNGDFQE